MPTVSIARIALLFRGTREARNQAAAGANRGWLYGALSSLNVAAEPAIYSDEMADEVRDQLMNVDGVLVWVDPISDGQNRTLLDAMLRDVASRGVFVSAHPDLILKMGTKEILFRTRHLGWGTDTCLYDTFETFRQQFPARLASSGPRVLKQYRGNGGIGTWKVQLAGSGEAGSDADPVVRVAEARSLGPQEELRLGDFMNRCERYFAGDGRLIDQAFQPRAADGMIRCYLVQNEVVGFSTQAPRGEGAFGMAREKTMYTESEPRFQALRRKMESEWVPAVQRLFGIDTNSLPVIWDADFLYGEKTATGEDTYVLCETNVSAVFPLPDTAVPQVARAALARALAAKEARHARR